MGPDSGEIGLRIAFGGRNIQGDDEQQQTHDCHSGPN